MNDFAKIFRHPDHGQILVLRQESDEDAPELRVFVQPAGLGLCSMAFTFTGPEGGHRQADIAFDRADEAFAFMAAAEVFRVTGPITAPGDEGAKT